eukprot:PhM_4_TR10057/c0_g1_i4/m.42433
MLSGVTTQSLRFELGIGIGILLALLLLSLPLITSNSIATTGNHITMSAVRRTDVNNPDRKDTPTNRSLLNPANPKNSSAVSENFVDNAEYCVNITPNASIGATGLFCPAPKFAGFMNMLMTYTYCVYIAWHFAQVTDVYLPLLHHAAPIHTLLDLEPARREVLRVMGIRLRVACPISAATLEANFVEVPFRSTYKNRAVRSRFDALRKKHPRQNFVWHYVFNVGRRMYPPSTVIPFIHLLVQRPVPIVDRLSRNILAKAKYTTGAHSRIEGDTVAIVGIGEKNQLRFTRFKRMFEQYVAESLADRSHAPNGKITVYSTYFGHGADLSVYGDIPRDAVTIWNKATILSQPEMDSITAQVTTEGRPCAKEEEADHRGMLACATLTNSTSALIDFLVMSSLPHAVVSAFSTFGQFVAVNRCTKGLTTRSYTDVYDLNNAKDGKFLCASKIYGGLDELSANRPDRRSGEADVLWRM